MERLVEVIKLIANKYMKKIDLILSENILTLEYLTYKYGEKDVYKTLQVEEFEIIEEQEKICPKCGNYIQGHPALSRADNKTEICSNCGTLEALEVFEKYQGEA